MEVADKVSELENRVTALEVSKPYMEKILEEVVTSNKELSKAIGSLQKFIGDMNAKIDNQGQKIEDLSAHIDSVDKKINIVEEKGKFDMIDWLKKNWPWILIVLGFGGHYVSQYVKI